MIVRSGREKKYKGFREQGGVKLTTFNEASTGAAVVQFKFWDRWYSLLLNRDELSLLVLDLVRLINEDTEELVQT